MAKYSYTGIDVFLSMPVAELAEWMEIISAEIKRENEAIKNAGKGK